MLRIAVTPSTNKLSRGLRAERRVWLNLIGMLPRGTTEQEVMDRRAIAARVEAELRSDLPVIRIDFTRDQATMILKVAGLTP